MRVIMLILALAITACGPSFVTHNNLNVLNKGMMRVDVHDALPMDFDLSHTITVGTYEYVVERYPLQTAQTSSTTTYSGPGVYGSGGYTTTTITDYTNAVYLIYRNDKLRYWGMMGDISKSEDLEMADLAYKLYDAIK